MVVLRDNYLVDYEDMTDKDTQEAFLRRAYQDGAREGMYYAYLDIVTAFEAVGLEGVAAIISQRALSFITREGPVVRFKDEMGDDA